MKNLMQQAVLVLNASYEPLALCAARRALTLVVKERAIIKEDADIEIYRGLKLPLVIMLKDFIFVPKLNQVVSRRNILARDMNTCQYCEKKLPSSELTLDHIIPKSKGGRDTYENLCAACQNCNRKKADKTLEESGVILKRRPLPPTIHTSRILLRSMAHSETAWKKYLFFDTNDHPNVTRGVE